MLHSVMVNVLTALLDLCNVFECLTQRYLSFFPCWLRMLAVLHLHKSDIQVLKI